MSNSRFFFATLVLAMGISGSLLFNLVGAVMVKNILGLGPYTFGKLALMIGGGYLSGNLINRLLLQKLSSNRIVITGFICYFICLIPLFILAWLNMFIPTVAIIFLLNAAVGLIFPNIMFACIAMCPQYPAMCGASQGFLMLALSSIAAYIISLCNITTTIELFFAFVVVFIIMLIAFLIYRRYQQPV